jgi:hypothetical protein
MGSTLILVFKVAEGCLQRRGTNSPLHTGRAWISAAVASRNCSGSNASCPIVRPNASQNSTSYAKAGSAYTSTTVPTIPARNPSSGMSCVRVTTSKTGSVTLFLTSRMPSILLEILNDYRISSVRKSGLLSCLSCPATSWSREIYFPYRGNLFFDWLAFIQVIFRGRPTSPVSASHNASKFMPHQLGNSSPSAIAICKSSSDVIFEPSIIKCIRSSSISRCPLGTIVMQ